MEGALLHQCGVPGTCLSANIIEEGNTEEINHPTPTPTINMTSKQLNLLLSCTIMNEDDVQLLPDHVTRYDGKAHGEIHKSRQVMRSTSSSLQHPHLKTSTVGERSTPSSPEGNL
ncbi:hypothetical protein N7456_000992 [Penicillium angulare]|uniref:Uncharacterized protein n=1 Tax=Penicillium angulare TaxID=116970 RepID=A0A9W9KSR7_9EURO|nr:hypothetical protein N7456_000992 [Penicillium angulare]